MAQFVTDRQKAILDFIREYRSRHGYSPTHREICEYFGYSSYGTVHKHLKLLEQKGYLRRAWNQKRGVELAERPPDGSESRLPFLGLIAAGRPIEALPGDETVEVPEHLLGRRGGEYYVLRVVGDSMIDEGIHDGDLVVVERQEKARAGEMVVALLGQEATLKRFYPESGGVVRLQPSNPAMEPIRAPAPLVRIQGLVVGLMRRF